MESTIAGYSIRESLSENEKTLVVAAVRERDQRAVVLKVLQEGFLVPQRVLRFKREFEILQRLKDKVKGVPQVLELEKTAGRWVLSFEDFGGRSLDRILQRGLPGLGLVLRWMIRLSEILEGVHRSDVIHKDFNPSNILWSQAAEDLQLIDFGIATVLSRENPTPTHPNVVEGTLGYMSPEQTGRMNRAMDYRTDYYSLGATFYELLTGRLPFQSTDALELLHCHLAKSPTPPHEINPAVPVAVSRITMKLLSKNAEERYQSAAGLRADLQACQTQLHQGGKVDDDLPIGKEDHSHRFQLSQKLYGRDDEIATILSRFSAISDGATEMLLVSGYSGIGKSSLVQEVYKPITEKRGYFITGKFDQFQRNIPYSAIIKAFQDLIRQLLTESAAELLRWRERLLQALGPNGQILTEVITELKMIVGPQPPVEQLGPAEAQNRFNMVFQNFLRVFCQAGHPLVFFLDDLQWADIPSLKLLDVIMTDAETRYLLLIGAYRDNEVSPTHPFITTIEGLRKHKAVVHEISLSPLNLAHITELIADTCQRGQKEVEPLAELVLAKTGGNPFFVNQFLRMLHQEGLLTFDYEHHHFHWNLPQIEAQTITDNVVDLMIAKLRKLPAEARQVVRLAACVGNAFGLEMLAIIHEKGQVETFGDLFPAIHEGFVLPTSDFATSGTDIRDAVLVIHNFRFLHDRVQQAAYALIDDSQRQSVHLKIGRLLLANLTPDLRDEHIFELTDHMNFGRPLITDSAEKRVLAGLNAAAGKKAQAAMAHAVALRYFGVGIELLPPDAFDTHYALALELYRESGRSAYLNGEFEKSTPLLEKALAGARSAFDREEIYRVCMNSFGTQGKFHEGIKAGYAALRLFGVELPESAEETAAQLNKELAEVQSKLRSRNIAELYDAPEMADEGQRIALELLIDLWALAYLCGNASLVNLCATRIVNVSLDQGNAKASSFGYVSYGMILGTSGDYKTAYELGHLALRLNDRYQHRSVIGKAINLFCHSLNPYRKPLRTNIPLYQRSHQACMEAGDMVYGVWALFFTILTRFLAGDALPDIAGNAQGLLPVVRKINDENLLFSFQALERTIWNFQGNLPSKTELDDSDFDTKKVMAVWVRNGFDSGINWYSYFMMQVSYFYGDYQRAYDIGKEVAPKVYANFGFFPQTIHNFYYSLAAAALYQQGTPAEKAEYLAVIEHNQVELGRWADNGPANFLHTCALVEAELARIKGEVEKAMDLYDQSIHAAKAQDCLPIEGLANELAARFWLERGRDAFARPYLQRARDAYRAWGGARKVEDLQTRYRNLLESSLEQPFNPLMISTGTLSTTHSTEHTALDLDTIIKASRSISGEIAIGKLLENMMTILLENAGAEHGYLLSQHAESWGVEAYVTVSGGPAQVLHGAPLRREDRVSLGIVNYAARAHEAVVLGNATAEGSFTRDPYILANKPLSVLCLPLITQGKLCGVVYFENNLTSGAFSPARAETIRLLGAQAAVSIENARVYASLEEKVKERTAELSATLRDLRAAQKQLVESEKLAALGSLVAGVAHEINTPVGIGVTAASHLKHAAVEFRDLYVRGAMKRSDLEKFLESLGEATSLLLANLNRAADLAQSFKQVAVDQSSEERRIFNLKQYLDGVFLSLRPRLKHTQHRVEMDCDDKLNLSSYPGAFSQILTNLVMNSITHAYDEGQTGKLTLTVRQTSDRIILTYSDDGKGIPADILPRIFEPFFTTRRGQGGSGLGLHIVYNLVTQRLHGQITATSQVGAGAEFCIELPNSLVRN